MLLLESESKEFVFLDNILPDGLGWEKTEYILHNYHRNIKIFEMSSMIRKFDDPMVAKQDSNWKLPHEVQIHLVKE